MDNPFELILQRLSNIEELITKGTPTATTPSLSPTEIIDDPTLCKRLNISRTTAATWRRKNKIPHLQIGSAIRYNYPSVIAALENKKSKA